MIDSKKSKKELLSELKALRNRLAEMEQKALPVSGQEEGWEKKYEQLRKSMSARAGELILLNSELRLQQSARERAESAYRNATEILDKIFSTLGISIAYLDSELAFVRVNHGYAATDGRPVDFFPGKKHFDLYPDQELEGIFRRVLRTGEPYTGVATPFKYPSRPEAGRTYWDWDIVPLRGDTGEIEGALFCSIDVTERVRAEEALREGEAKFRRVFDQSPIGAAIVGLDYHFQKVNDEYCRITGYTEEEMTSMTFKEITYPDDLQMGVDLANDLVAGKIDHYQIDKRYVRKDGRIIWARLSVRLLHDQEGKPLYFLPLVEDITEAKQAEEALRESEERYRLHFEHISDVVYITGLDFKVIDISPSARALSGYDPEEIIGHRIDELNLLSPEYLETALRNTQRVLDGNKSGPTEYEFIMKDGSRKFGEISGAPLMKDGKVIAMISVARDITARKEIEAELGRYRLHLEDMVGQRTAELIKVNRQLQQEIDERKKVGEKLRNQIEFSERLIDSSTDAIIAFDSNCRFTVWNPPMELVTGIPKEEVLGKNAFDLFPYLVETGEDQNYLAVLDGKSITSRDRPYYVQATGREGFYEAHYAPLKDEAGSIIGGVAVIRDITQRKHAEEKLRESEEKYRRLSEALEAMVKKQVDELKQAESLAAIGKMISVVSHEIRNPLQNIQLGFEMLRKAFLDNDQIATLSDVEHGVTMLNETVDELLDFARPTRLNCRPCKVETIIKHSVSHLQPQLQKVSLHLDVNQGDQIVLVDREKMLRVLINLMLNAIEAVPVGGEVRVFSSLFREEDKVFLRLGVSDKGIGIDEENLLQVTQPFFTTKPRGTGLGLSICKKIVEAHSGRMSITSRFQEGTSVEVIIPAEKPVEKAFDHFHESTIIL